MSTPARTPLKDVFFTEVDESRCKAEHVRPHLGCPVCFLLTVFLSEAVHRRAGHLDVEGVDEEVVRRMRERRREIPPGGPS